MLLQRLFYGGTAYRICLEQQVTSLCNSHLTFSPSISVNVRFSNNTDKVVQTYNSPEMTTAWKNSRLILSEKSDFHSVDNQSIVVHSFHRPMLIPPLVDEILLRRYVKSSTHFVGFSFDVKVSHYSTLFYLSIRWDQCFLLAVQTLYSRNSVKWNIKYHLFPNPTTFNRYNFKKIMHISSSSSL